MYVLIAKTKGDDLIPPTETIVAASHIKRELVWLMADRKREREFNVDKLPWWAENGLIVSERIEEVEIA